MLIDDSMSYLSLHACVFLKVHDQQEAEKKKATSQEIQEALRVQTQKIAEKKEVVLTDLSKVEPAVKDAQKGGYNHTDCYVLCVCTYACVQVVFQS